MGGGRYVRPHAGGREGEKQKMNMKKKKKGKRTITTVNARIKGICRMGAVRRSRWWGGLSVNKAAHGVHILIISCGGGGGIDLRVRIGIGK